MTDPLAAFWSKYSATYDKQGPPLTPAGDDIAALERCAADWFHAAGRAPRAVLLGVTPAIAAMRWPAGSALIAVDRAEAMIRDVWPKHRAVPSWAVCGDWREMPLADGSADLAFCDGGFTLVPYPNGYKRIFGQLWRVLTPRGAAAIRFHVRPDRPENPAAVLADLRAGRIAGFHVFKWRLVAALQTEIGRGVRLGDVFEAWRQAVGAESAAGDWPPQALDLMRAYRGVDARYTFPTLAELRRSFDEFFREEKLMFPPYELGERCPTIVLGRR